jgi:hypothetical protein
VEAPKWSIQNGQKTRRLFNSLAGKGPRGIPREP